MIRALDPKLNPASAEIQSLKAQLSEKDKKIIALEVKQTCLFCFTCHLHIAISGFVFSQFLTYFPVCCFFLFSLMSVLIPSFFTQRECEQAKLREYEEKLIVTAWYNKVQWQDSICTMAVKDAVIYLLFSVKDSVSYGIVYFNLKMLLY